MDGTRFDSLSRTLAQACSRRGSLGGLLAGALGLLGSRSEDATAHNPLKKCKKKSGDAKKKCVKKARKHNAAHTVPTCSDGIQNGSETGIDCGGNCPGCSTGQVCSSPNDCASAVCSGTCQACMGGSCGSDGDGNCNCAQPEGGGERVCVKDSATLRDCPNIPCPAGMICHNSAGFQSCSKRCGAP